MSDFTKRYEFSDSGNGSIGITSTSTNILTNKRYIPRSFSTTSLSILTPEVNTYSIFNLTAQAVGLTIANQVTSTPNDGEQIRIVILDNGTPQTISFGNTYIARGGIPLSTTTISNKLMELGFEWKSSLSAWNLIALAIEV